MPLRKNRHEYRGNSFLGDVPTDLSLHEGSSPYFIGCGYIHFVVHLCPLPAGEYTNIFPLMRSTTPQWVQKTFTRITTFLNGPLSGQGHGPLGRLACSWGLLFEDCLLYCNKDPWALAVESLSGDPLHREGENLWAGARFIDLGRRLLWASGIGSLLCLHVRRPSCSSKPQHLGVLKP